MRLSSADVGVYPETLRAERGGFVTVREGAKTFLRLLVTQVRLYMDCEEYHRVAFNRNPQPLTFEASSGIFVGNAGATGLSRFVVSPTITSQLVVAALLVLPPLRRLAPARRRGVWTVASETGIAEFAGSLRKSRGDE